MPIGFSNSILGAGAGSTADFSLYDGSNDVTFTRNAAVQGFLGFAAFNDEYGVSLHIKDAGGSNADQIRYDVVRNNGGSLSIPSQDQTFLTTNTSNFTNFKANLVRTNAGNIFIDTNDAETNDAAIFSISGSTVTKHSHFNSTQSSGAGGRMYRRPGGNVYVNFETRGAELVTLTDNGNSSSTSTGAATSIASSNMFYNHNRAVSAFKDANTALMWKSLQPSGESATIQPFELDLTSTGTQSVTTISGVSALDLDLNGSSSNVVDFSNAGASEYETTDFNDTLMFIERKGSTPGQVRVHQYTSGAGSITTSNTLTYSAGGDNDISATGCFVGADNDVFVFAHLQDGSNMIICKFIKSTNTVSQIARISETFNIEKCRISRWGDNAALLQYNDTKMRLIKL